MEHIKKVALSVLAAMAAVCMAVALLFLTLPTQRVSAATVTAGDADALQAAINDAGEGDVIQLAANITGNITVPEGKDITLDLNGFTLTNESDHTIMNYGVLTIVDDSMAGTGTVDNVTHARGALFNFGEATLLGGTYMRSLENGSSATESGGNSWYVIKNLGHLTIGEENAECDVAVTQSGHFSSMITNGYYNADGSGDHLQYFGSVTTEDKIPTLVINGGTFSGGINTVKNDNHSVAVINGGEFTNVSQAVVLNWNDLTITGGEFVAGEDAQAAIITSYDNTGFNDGTTTITGGTFKGAVTTDYNPGNVTYSVSGGTFSEGLPADYIAEDAVLYQQVDGSYTVADSETAAEDGVVVVMDGVGYASLEEAVAAAPTDNTQVTITFVDGDGDKVIAGNGVVVKAGQNIVFDYNGNTYDIDGTTVGSSGTETNGFQLLKGSTVVMQNGTLTSDKAIILIQKYCDLTLDDMILDGTQTNNYVLSNNNDTTTITGDTQIIAAGSGVAFDVCYWDAYDEVSVVFDEAFTGSVQGVIEYGVYSYTGSAEEWIENTSIAIKGEGSFDVTIRMMKYDDADPADANISVSSGTFVKPIAEEYIAEDSLLIPAGDGTYTVEDYESAVGTVTGLIVGNAVYADIAAAEEAGVHVVATIAASESLTYGYTTLIDALRAATAENMVVLADNVTTGGITAGKSFNIDLNEHSIEFTGMFLLNGTDVEGGITVNISNGTIKGTNYGIVAFNNVTLGLTDANASGSLEGIFVPTSVGETKADKPTTITIEGGIFKGTGENGAGAVICGVGDGVEAPTKLVATGAVFEGTTYGISGNGTAHNTYIELSDCTVNGEVGIYNPQDGELIVNGGSVYGESTGIEIRSGSLTVNGGAEITGAGDPFASDPNGNGTTTTGAAIAVSQHTTNLPIKVTVNDAVLNGVRALFEADLQDEVATDQITITVLGGTFNGEVVSENVTGFVKGGAFTEALDAAYVAADAYFYPTDTGYEASTTAPAAGATTAVAVVNGYYYCKTLAEAVAAAEEGDTVTLLADVSVEETIVVEKALTLDLNGFDIASGVAVLKIVNAGEVTITDRTAAPGTIASSVNGNTIDSEGTDLTIENVTIENSGNGYTIVFRGNQTPSKAAAADPSTFNTLTLDHAKVNAYMVAISGNGSADKTWSGTIIRIENSKIVAQKGTGIYHPQYGIVNVSGDSAISGGTGIEMRAGELNVNGGTITGTWEQFTIYDDASAVGGGTTIDGAAVAISQHTTNLPIRVTINGGTLLATGVDGKSLYEVDLYDEKVADIAISLMGGTFENAVESENVTGFIHGGQYKVLPAEELFVEGYTGELYNGYYIVVGEGTAAEDVGALLTARLEAQTDVRLYAAALGFRWADVQDDAEIASAYAAINAATSTSAVALAKAQAMDAIDAYRAAYEEELAAAREAALEKIEAAAGDDIAVPTSVYAAINGGTSVEEIEAYAEAAVKEIDAIRSLRSEITAQAGELEGIAAAVEKLEGAFAGQGGEFDSLLGDIRAAISAAQEAIESGTSEALQDMQAALEAKIDAGTQAVKDAVSGVMEELTELAESVAAGDKALQEAIAAGEKALAEQIEAVQGDIDALEGAVDGQGSDLQASIDALESAVGEQASAVQADIDALSAAIAAAQADIDDILASIAAGGPSFEELAEQIAAIKSTADGLQTSVGDVQTAVKAAQDAVAAAQGALSGQIEEADDAAAFTTLYVLVGIALALSAAAVALLVVLLLKRSKAE